MGSQITALGDRGGRAAGGRGHRRDLRRGRACRG
jgi:hypothetical protein